MLETGLITTRLPCVHLPPCLTPPLGGNPQEASFSRTLLKGIERFKKAAAGAKDGKVSGADAFLLWDTYGFPLDLTQVCGIVQSPPGGGLCCVCFLGVAPLLCLYYGGNQHS